MPEYEDTNGNESGDLEIPIDSPGAEEELAESLVSDSSQVLPGDPRAARDFISAEQRDELENWITLTIEIFWSATRQRRERWREINDAYMLIPDPSRAGLGPDQAKLVSEHTRSQVNNASARLAEGLLGTKPWLDVQVVSDTGADDPVTMELINDAKVISQLFDSYMDYEIRADEVIPLLSTITCKLGSGPLKVHWVEKNRDYQYLRDDGKEIATKRSRHGGIEWELINPGDFIAWPLWETKTDKLEMVGHRSRMSVAEWKAWANERGVDQETIELVAQTASTTPDKETKRRLEAQEIHDAGTAPPGEVEICELWIQRILLGDEEPTKIQVFYSDVAKRAVWVGRNTIRCGRHGYFRVPYWLDDLAFFASGVGHEVMFAQAGDSALLNMLIDNMKVVGNVIRLVKQNSGAEVMSHEIAPGITIPTEDPDGDFKTVSLGEPLDLIYQAMQEMEKRKTASTGITHPSMGLADPVLKSGASPGHYQMLLAESGKKFGQVDRHMRAEFSRIYSYMLELFQQYASNQFIEVIASQENASVLKRMKYKIPAGDLSAKFRIKARAPSASSNRETMKQHLVLVYQMATEHVQMIQQLAAQVWEQANAAKILTYAEAAVKFLSWVFRYIVELNDIPGAEQRLPDVDSRPSTEEEFINQLQEQLQQYQQAYEQVAAELEQLRNPIPPEQQALQQEAMIEEQAVADQGQQPGGVPSPAGGMPPRGQV